ncbi:MAG: GntR family transcriptional regulator [Casimicrobium sp.]
MTSIRFNELAAELANDIATGTYPVGTLLPKEMALCEQYGASRHTVRAAIAVLSDQGLVSRRKKAGTRIESATPVTAFRQTLASVRDLMHFGESHSRVVRQVADETANRTLAGQLGCEIGKHWLRISSLRLGEASDELPVGWTDVYVDARFTDVATLARDHPGVLVSSLIEQRYGLQIAAIEQDIQGGVVPKALAKALQAEAGSPALRITRRYIDAEGETFEVSITVHPADRFTFSSRMTREGL